LIIAEISEFLQANMPVKAYKLRDSHEKKQKNVIIIVITSG
jgi:hypothetical protein